MIVLSKVAYNYATSNQCFPYDVGMYNVRVSVAALQLIF